MVNGVCMENGGDEVGGVGEEAGGMGEEGATRAGDMAGTWQGEKVQRCHVMDKSEGEG